MSTKKQVEYIKDFKLCDKDHFRILKGISILMVILAHFCSQYLSFSGLMPLQGVAAAVFLLCSGYGVSESFKNKSGMPHYWENKAIKVWLPSVVITVIFSVISGGGGIDWVGENPLALHGWFLYLLFGEYLAFWLAFYYLDSKEVKLIALFAVSLLCFALISSEPVAAQLFCFPVGVLFSQLGGKYPVRSLKAGGQVLLCVVLAAVAAGAFFLHGYVSQQLLRNICWVLFCMSGAALLCVGTYFVRKIGIFGVFAPVGTISYALYLLHEKVLTLLVGRMEWRIAVAVFVALFVIAALFGWLCRLLEWYNKKLRRSKSTQLKGSMR